MATSVLELKTVTDIAAAWFGWDIDEPSPVVEESPTVPQTVPDTTILHLEKYIPTPKQLDDNEELTASQRLAIWSSRYEYHDWELQDILDNTTSIHNHSGQSLADYKKDLGAVIAPDASRVWSGATHNATKLKASAALSTRYINVKDSPRYNRAWYNKGKPEEERQFGWVYDTPPLPNCMPFDVDENKPGSLFPKLFNVRCYQLFEAYPGLSKPAFVTVNADSLNAHYLFFMCWTDVDFANIPATLTRYNTIRKRLTALFGADCEYQGAVIRSPLYKAGQHRKDPRKKPPRRKTSSGVPIEEKVIDISVEAPFAYGILYPIVGYTLDELEQLANQLEAILGREKVTMATAHYQDWLNKGEEEIVVPCGDNSTTTTSDNQPTKKCRKKSKTRKKKNGGTGHDSFPMKDQWRHVNTPAHLIKDRGMSRNKWVTANLSLRFCRREEIANQYRHNRAGYLAYATERAMELYAQLPDKRDFPVSEVHTIARSVVGYCMSKEFKVISGRCWSSEEASYVARCRWELEKECRGETSALPTLHRVWAGMSFYQQMISCRYKN